MKIKPILTSALLLFFTASASFATTNSHMNSHNAMTNSDSMSQRENDAAILAWLVTLDKNEIAAANIAVKRDVNPSVSKFAHYLIKEHSQNLKQTLTISKRMGVKPITTNQSTELHEQGQQELASLQSLDNKAFQKAYINAMVTGHSNALAKLEKDISTVQNKALKHQLQMTAKHVAHHLAIAKSIQKEIEG